MDKEWTGYQSANNDFALPKSTSAIYPTSSSEKGIVGFQDLTPYAPDVQARYDAMSGSWEGVNASKAYAKNIAKAQTGPAPAESK
jgi:hypothetical protein